MPGGSKATPIQKNLDFNRRGKRQLAYASGRLAMTDDKRRITISSVLLLYCFVLYLAFDFAFTALTMGDPRRYRVFDYRYHHSLIANFDGYDSWGNNRYRLLTNSLGFKDAAVREITKASPNRRILLIGDSFTEGIGLPFEQTFAGKLYSAGQNGKEKIEFLNAGVASYSPSIYFKKIQALLSDGFHFDEVVVFSDLSDVTDEASSYFCIDDDPKYRAFCDPADAKPPASKKSFVSSHLKVTDAIGDWIEKKVDPPKPPLPLDAFRTEWIYPNPSAARYEPLGVEGGVARSVQNMTALAELLKQKKIPLTIVVYPWPAQLARDDRDNRQIQIWSKFCQDHCKEFVNLFPAFFTERDKAPNWYERLFVPGDFHYSEAGNEIIFRAIQDRLLRNATTN